MLEREKIRAAIEQRGLTRYAFAKRLGVQQAGLDAVLSGRQVFRIEALDRLVDVCRDELGIEVDALKLQRERTRKAREEVRT